MSTKRVAEIQDRLHFRAWHLLVATAENYNSDVQVSRDGITVDAKQLFGLVKLSMSSELQGGEIEVEATGDDETEAVHAICSLVERGFGETGGVSTEGQ